MGKPNYRIVSLVAAGALLTVSFQNCGKAGLDNTGLAVSSSSTKTSMPFAYDATFDQISYNSCFGTGVAAKPGFFSIRAGAYESGGVKITDAFRTHAKTSGVLKPIYPETEVSDLQMKLALASSTENRLAIPQMAFRTRTNVQQVRTPGSKQATLGIDYADLLGDLTDDRWLSPLVNTVGSHVFFDLAPDGMRNLEGSITYNKDEGTAHGLRRDLGSHGMLALTFKVRPDVGDLTVARAPNYEDVRSAYGRGYVLGFEAVVAPYTQLCHQSPGQCACQGCTPESPPLPLVPHIQAPQNILTTVTEVDLMDPSKATSARWSCHSERRYVIVRQEDAATHCPMDPWQYTQNANYRREMEIVRRHLKPEHWNVSISARCAVPKSNEGSCYRNDILDGALVAIEYDQRRPCFQAIDEVQYSPPIPIKQCAQYVSICTRDVAGSSSSLNFSGIGAAKPASMGY